MLSIVLATLVLSSFLFGGWTFDSVFYHFDNTEVTNSYGMHGVAVDGSGNIWFGMYGYATDTSYSAQGDTIPVYQVFAMTPAGENLAFSPISYLSINGAQDTMKSACRGIAKAGDGNILYSVAGKMYKINATTGDGMGMYDFPDYTGSLTKPAVDAAGNIYLGTVGKQHPVKILAPDLTEIGNAIDSLDGAYTRAIAVSSDGHDLYFGSTWSGIGIRHYHSDIPGVLPHEWVNNIGGWQVDDSTFVELWPEDVSMGPDGKLYAANTQIDFTGDEDHGSRWWVYAVDGSELYSFGAPLGDYAAGGIWNGRGAAWNADGTTMYLADFGYNCITAWSQVPDGVDQPVTIPDAFDLKQNFPNPFNPSTSIPYELHEDGLVRLTVYDLNGREIATLVNAQQTAGNHIAHFDGSQLSSGLYVYQISFNGQISAKNMLLVK